MKKLIFAAILAAAACGCRSPKSRSLDASGMYVSETGRLAIGKIHVDAIPEGQESAVIHYSEDTALLSPSTKTHDIDVILTGTNAVYHATSIVGAICNAFIAVVPKISEADSKAPKSATTLDVAQANAAANAKVKEAKIAAKEKVAAAVKDAQDKDAKGCPDCVDTNPECPECQVAQ